jgi:carboxyl-terminal processing protease
MVLTAVNGVPVGEAIQPFLGRTLRAPDAAARDFALRQLLAGDHRTPRVWSLSANGSTRTARPDEPAMQLENIRFPARLEVRHLSTVDYLKINNSLGDNGLIADFDSALATLHGSAGLILDLRETPSGGTTTVARAIMGRFIGQEAPYQRHELTREETETGIRRSWLELVSPRAPRIPVPLVVLVGRWTGSMGEGLAIGFDALHRATVVGTEMAQLKGAIYSYKLPNSGIGFAIPVERVFHINGQPREAFRPPHYVDLTKASKSTDPVLQEALSVLQYKN